MKRLIVALLFGLTCISAQAAVPHLINYQSSLADAQGNLLQGSYEITFKIYDAGTGGNLLWQETHSGVTVQEGLFNVMLGGVSALNLPFDAPYFLEIKVGSEVMSPRQQISSVGYAMRAETAENALNAANADNADKVGDKTYNSTDLKPFGSVEAKSFHTVYQAATDGFVMASATDATVYVYVDSNPSPTTKRVMNCSGGAGVTCPVKKGEYWKAWHNGTPVAVYWMSVGD